jgi:glycosyltransferase involved in cell wall biosynthesis
VSLLRVEGWRKINHSYAVVNQFQLLELLKRPELTLSHLDLPYLHPHWGERQNGIGLSKQDILSLDRLASASVQTACEAIYRISSPLDLHHNIKQARLAVFAVTELGLEAPTSIQLNEMRQFEAQGGLIITPSTWSAHLIMEHGFAPSVVKVIPHAASEQYFFPQEAGNILAQRQALGFVQDEVLLLNIGAPLWNKGLDILIKAFAIAHQKRSNLRLIIKDQQKTYGLSGNDFIRAELVRHGLLTESILNAITLLSVNLNLPQMNSLYNCADWYISPYRAEGFNLPALEAMACGTPVIVTGGGATDEFVFGSPNHRLKAKEYRQATIQNRTIGAYREPELDELIQLLLAIEPKKLPAQCLATPPFCSWALAADRLASLFS